MSFAALARVAGSDPGWTMAWKGIGDKLKHNLIKNGMDDPLLGAGIRGGRDQLVCLYSSMGILEADPVALTAQLDDSQDQKSERASTKARSTTNLPPQASTSQQREERIAHSNNLRQKN